MNVRKITALFTIGLLFSAQASLGGDPEVKAAAKATNEAFSTTSYEAKMDLRRYAHFYVLPDGSPSTKKGKKKQGRGGEGAIQFDDGVKVGSGDVGESIRVYPKGDQVWVGFNKKRGKTMNPAIVHILYGRPVTADDITPEKIARAVSSVAIIRGFEPGEDIADAFDEALAAAGVRSKEVAPSVASSGATPSATASSGSALVSLQVRTEPATARAGGEVELILEYEVRSPGGEIEAVETRTLSLAGAALPGYPVIDRLMRGAGLFTSSFRQPIPPSAKSGTYTLKGEVCVAGDCISRSATFELTR